MGTLKMKVFIFAICLILVSSTFTKLHRRRLEGGPTDAASAMGILNTIAGNVKVEVKLDANVLFNDIKTMFMNDPNKDDFATVINATGKAVNMEGCPTTSIGQVMGCNPHMIGPGKPYFI